MRHKGAEARKRDRLLALVEAREELYLAEKAYRQGNRTVAGMILRSVKGKMAYMQGKPYAPSRTSSQRPDVVRDAELRSTRRRLDLLQAQQN